MWVSRNRCDKSASHWNLLRTYEIKIKKIKLKVNFYFLFFIIVVLEGCHCVAYRCARVSQPLLGVHWKIHGFVNRWNSLKTFLWRRQSQAIFDFAILILQLKKKKTFRLHKITYLSHQKSTLWIENMTHIYFMT